jgi:hypothetical protein
MTAATASPYPLLSAPTRTSIRSTLTTGCRPRCRSSHRNGGCPNEPARGRHRGLRGYAGGKLDRHIPDPDGLYILPECARASEGARFARAQDHCRLSSSQWLERARALAIACRHSQIELRMTGTTPATDREQISWADVVRKAWLRSFAIKSQNGDRGEERSPNRLHCVRRL